LSCIANQNCWKAQNEMEQQITQAFKKQGYTVKRAHPYDSTEKHGFISSQKHGIEVFKSIPKNVRLVVAEAVWQYSHHVLAGLRDHQGPILVVANWNGQWPGLVGALNLGGSLTKMNKPYSILWSKKFDDEFFETKLKEWINTGSIKHDQSHVRDLSVSQLSTENKNLGIKLANKLQSDKSIMGIFDEGCMGMYNAIIDDELLNPLGIYKERLSQSALLAAMRTVSDDEAKRVKDWLDTHGMQFNFGSDPKTELTLDQVLEQCKMYIAAARISNDFGCDTIGIQYQQGLKDLTAASDLVEGILNNKDRPPVYDKNGKELYAGQPLPVFNEVDEGAAVDIVITNRVWNALGFDPSTTLHDVRYGEDYNGEFVWVFEISGSAPPNHFIGGYKGTISERQPAMYFPLGGGSVKGISKPGEVVWSRVYIQNHELHCDIGLASVRELPKEETERRWNMTTKEWPIMHAVLKGVTQNQLMGRHKANHVQVVYAPSVADAEKALQVKAAMMNKLGIKVHLCGV
jgi:hypothetical protein